LTDSETEGVLGTPVPGVTDDAEGPGVTGDATGAGVTDDAEADVTRSDAADICSDEITVSSTAAEVDVTPVLAAETQEPVAGEMSHDESCQLLKPDDERSAVSVVKDEADALNVENDEECSTALVTGGVVECDSDTVHVVEDTSCEDGQRNNTQDQDVKATVDNVEVESEKTQPAVCDDSSRNEDPGDSAKTTRKIDWDALEKPKPKLSGGDAEFSQVFNKVVKQKSAAGSKDSQHTTQRTYSSRTDLLVSSELRSNAAGRHFPSKTSKVSGKTEAERPNTLQLSSSTADEQVDTGKSVVSTERQTESVEVQETAVSSMSCTQSSPCTRLSLAAKESSVMSKTKPEADDTTLTSVASVTESRDADTKLSSTGENKTTC